MANDISFTIPENWINEIIKNLRQVLAANNLFNTKYEGTIKKMGDIVNIPKGVTTGGLKSYTKSQTLVSDEVKIRGTQLIINQQKYFAFDVDNIDTTQSGFGEMLLQIFMDNALYKGQKTIDSYLLESYADVASANIIGAATYAGSIQITKNTVLDNFIALVSAIKNKNIYGNNNVVIPTWMTAVIEQAQINIIQDAEIMKRGLPGYKYTFAGLNVFESNNIPVQYTTGAATTLNGEHDEDATTIAVAAAAGLTASGYIKIDDEIIYYSGKSVNNLTGCTRGMFNTEEAEHATGVAVTQITDFFYPILACNPDLFGTYAMQLQQSKFVEPDREFTIMGKGLYLYGKKVVEAKAGSVLYAKQ